MFFLDNNPFNFNIQTFDFVSTRWYGNLNKTIFVTNWFGQLNFIIWICNIENTIIAS